MTTKAKSLPIHAIKQDVITALEHHQTVLLTAPPGAGKSTCLPLWLLEMPCLQRQKIYLLQPRRLAAKNIACYLARQLGEDVGKTVGYRLRNDQKVSSSTRLEVITEGILSQIIQSDEELSGCGLVVFDEFHERSLNADLSYALTRDVQQGLRDDLKILLMSATLATEYIQQQLPDAKTLVSEGRSFAVDISYQAPTQQRLWREHASKVIKSAVNEHQGSILVFLPTTADIRYLSEQLLPLVPTDVILCSLYGDLSLDQQQQAIAAPINNQRKLVLATNIAETSLTIEGVTLVIDSGLENVASYDPSSLSNKLILRQIAKDSAIQRAGRAGRLSPGRCIRLYSKEDFERRNEHSLSEIQQADLLPMLLEVARWGANCCEQLPMIEQPKPKHEQLAWQELGKLGLVSTEHKLTEDGRLVASYPVHPRFAKMVVGAQKLNDSIHPEHLLSLACILTALLEEKDIFTKAQRQFDCDISHRVIQVLRQPKRPQYQRIIIQAKRLLRVALQQISHGKVTAQQLVTDADLLPLNQCGLLLLFAYPERLAKKRDTFGQYLSAYGKGVEINEQDALANEPYVIVAQLFQRQHTLQVALAAPIDITLAIEHQLIDVKEQCQLIFDPQQQKILTKKQQLIGNIVIKEEHSRDTFSTEQIVSCWCQQIRKRGITWLNFNNEMEDLLLRWRWINQTQAHLAFINVSDSQLLSTLETWLGPYLLDVKTKGQLDKVCMKTALLTQLNYQQQQVLSEVAPTHFVGPTGRRCAIRYSEEQAPIVSLPMQELYGMSTTPSVGDSTANRSVALILELLSPAQRPIQITQDLVAFWQGSYRAVQKEMKSRYPKHFWPDDPANAQATRKTKRHIKT